MLLLAQQCNTCSATYQKCTSSFQPLIQSNAAKLYTSFRHSWLHLKSLALAEMTNIFHLYKVPVAKHVKGHQSLSILCVPEPHSQKQLQLASNSHVHTFN